MNSELSPSNVSSISLGNVGPPNHSSPGRDDLIRIGVRELYLNYRLGQCFVNLLISITESVSGVCARTCTCVHEPLHTGRSEIDNFGCWSSPSTLFVTRFHIFLLLLVTR